MKAAELFANCGRPQHSIRELALWKTAFAVEGAHGNMAPRPSSELVATKNPIGEDAGRPAQSQRASKHGQTLRNGRDRKAEQRELQQSHKEIMIKITAKGMLR